jgi:hypothetical protein
MKRIPRVVLLAQLQRERWRRKVADEGERERGESREGRMRPSGCRYAIQGGGEDSSGRAEEETMRSGS